MFGNLIAIRSAEAQGLIEKPNIEYLSAADGYPFTAATAILQDRDGFIWISSLDGLVRYDGYRFLMASDFLKLPNKTIFTMAEGRDGKIWTGHLGGFVTCFDPRKFQTQIIEIPEGKDSDVVDLLCDSNGNIWASIRGIGLAKFNGTNGFNIISPLRDPKEGVNWYNNISDMQDDGENLWLGSFNGLYRMNITSLKMDKVSALSSDPNAAIPVRAITKVGDKIWTATYGNGVMSYDIKTDQLKKFTYQVGPSGTNNIVNSLVPLNESQLLLGTSGNGIGTLDMNNGKFTFYFEPDDFGTGPLANTIILDRSGIVWSTTDKGLLKWRLRENNIVFSKLGVTRSDNGGYYGVTDVLEDGNRRLIASNFADGLYIIRGNKLITKTFATAKGAEPFLIIGDLFKDSKNNTWVVTRDYLFRLTSTDELVEEKSIRQNLGDTLPYFSRMIETSAGDLVVSSTREGAFMRIKGSRTWERITSKNSNLANNRILRMAEDHRGRIWFVHNVDGVSIFNRKENSFGHLFASAFGLNNSRLTDVTSGPNGEMWVSSIEGLFVVDNDTSKVTRIGEEHGLPSRVVYSILSDVNGNMWVTTSKGLSVITRDREVKSFDIFDGLKGVNASFALRRGVGDEMYIVTFQGFYTFYPAKLLNPDKNNAPTVITGVRNNDQPYFLYHENQTTVNYDSNNLSIEFATLNFSNRQKNRYQYMLNDLDEKWVETNDNVVNYAGLPSGNYTFRVKAAGQPDQTSASLKITVTAPVWKQKWFLAATVVLFVLSSYVIYSLRLKHVRNEEQMKAALKEKLNEMEMKALRAQMSPHFIFNSLNSINRYIVTSDPETASNYLTKFSKLMRLILENSNHKIVSLEQELSALKLYIELEAMRFNHKFRYTMHVDENVDASLVGVPPMVIQPFIENAIWHGLLHKDDTRELSIKVRRNGDFIQCIIEDNGVGRKKAQELKSKSISREKSFGLKITTDRLKMANNNSDLSHVEIIDLHDNAGQASGTKVIVNISVAELEPEFSNDESNTD
jgi:ligand-binding sensor domain-containing protein